MRGLFLGLKKFGTVAVICTIATTLGSLISLSIAGRGVDLTEQAQIVDRVDKAGVKLKSPDIIDQLNGIAELQRVAEGSRGQVQSVIDQLTVFLRLKADARDTSCGSTNIVNIATSAVAAIGKLNTEQNRAGVIDLSHTCLVHVIASKANLSNTDFTGANLTDATFIDTNLSKARFDVTTLTDTKFVTVDLTDAVLCFTNISRADFRSGTFRNTALDYRENLSISQRPVDLSRTKPC